MITIRDLLNTCDHFKNISLWEITPDNCGISFDPDESTFLCTTDDMRTLPDEILQATVNLWTMENDNILIHFER